MEPQTTDAAKRRMGCLKKGLLLLGVLLVLLLGLGMGGLIYERRAEAAVVERFPALGQLVLVKGRSMHIHCQGEGSPTIILDAGQGGWSSDWANIIPQLSQHNRVCAYDRAGYGWSEAAQDERSPQDIAGDLAATLDAAQIEGPYVLVAFSHAGLAARIFAAQYADQMAGLVLIDPATEFDKELMSAELRQQQQAAVGMFQGFGFLARFGLVRLMGPQNMAESAPFISTGPADPEVYYAFVAAPQWWDTSTQEFASGLNDEHMALVRQQGAIPNIPLIIIGSDVLDATGAKALDDLQTARQNMLSDLATQSAQGEFIIAEGSSHNILTDRPDVVVKAIDATVAISH